MSTGEPPLLTVRSIRSHRRTRGLGWQRHECSGSSGELRRERVDHRRLRSRPIRTARGRRAPPLGHRRGGVRGADAAGRDVQRGVGFHGGRPDPSGNRQLPRLSRRPGPGPAGPWVESATDSTVWQHVPAGRNADFFRQHVAEAVATLARWREAAESGTTADPWRDDGFVPRFAEAVEWLLGEPDPGRPLDLYPAEAALLVLMPFLHRVQCLRLTASLAPVVEPGRLGRITGAPPLRTAFEAWRSGSSVTASRSPARTSRKDCPSPRPSNCSGSVRARTCS
ncbi:HD domain-containing protein [Streptomyces netropsis]